MKKFLLICLLLLSIFRIDVPLVFNQTSSMPLGFYKITFEEPKKHNLVLLCVPNSWAEIALNRGYLKNGTCENNTIPLLKEVTATAGEHIPRLEIALTDSQERLIFSTLESTNTPVPKGYAFVEGKGKGSFDSRYFGLVPLHDLQVVKPLFTF